MKTPIEDARVYRGWTIQLYLEAGGFSFRVTPPPSLPFAAIEDGMIYSTFLSARYAAKKLIKVERAAMALESWLLEMYWANQLSLAECEALCASMRDAFVEGGTL